MLGELLQDEKTSVLFSTHLTADLERIADFITFIRDGRIVFSTPKDVVLDRFALVKGGRELLDAASRGLFDGIRVHAHGFEGLTSRVNEVRNVSGIVWRSSARAWMT